MDFCDEGDLNSFMKRRLPADRQFLPEADARLVLKDVVRGLAHLTHVCRVIHRDIKLDNILVKSKVKNQILKQEKVVFSEYEFKVGDLGLAKAIVDGANELSSTVCGTPLCMAPEVIHGQRYGYKADVWSLGTLLFQMLTGQYPFGGKDLDELKSNLRRG
jgi:serine/threonine-protein kinase ULK/ATG1